jgi:hypothetical protein
VALALSLGSTSTNASIVGSLCKDFWSVFFRFLLFPLIPAYFLEAFRYADADL